MYIIATKVAQIVPKWHKLSDFYYYYYLLMPSSASKRKLKKWVIKWVCCEV